MIVRDDWHLDIFIQWECNNLLKAVKGYKYSSKMYNFVQFKETNDNVSNSNEKSGFGGAKRPFWECKFILPNQIKKNT